MDVPPIQYATTGDGVRIAYMRYPGTSPAFLATYTPGTPPITHKASSPGYAAWFEAFARGQSWIWFDWRGTGSSGGIREPLNVEHLALDVDAVAQANGGPFHGWAVGRSVPPTAYHVARRPDLYMSLWMRSPFFDYNPAREPLNRPGWDRDYREHMRLLCMSLGMAHSRAQRVADSWIRAVPQHSFAAYLEVAKRAEWRTLAAEIQTPVWVTAGRDGHLADAAEVAAALPDAVLSTWPNTAMNNPLGDWTRDDWDRYLGFRLEDGTSSRAAPINNGHHPELTSRESEVLAHLAASSSNADIAAALGLSPRTIDRHLSNIYAKLGAHNRVAATNWARDNLA